MSVEKIEGLPSASEIQNEINKGAEQEPTPPKKRNTLKPVLYVLCGIAVVLVVITWLTSNGTSLSNKKGSISGNVVNELSTPLPAEVYVVSTKLGTTANSDGNFVLENVPEGNREVIVTYNGQGVDLQVKVTENQQLSLGVIQIRSTQIPTK